MSIVRCRVNGCPHYVRTGLRNAHVDHGADGTFCWRCRQKHRRAANSSSSLKKVVKRESNGEQGFRGGGSWIDTLTCGHVVVAKRSAGSPTRRRCKECSGSV